MSSYIAVIHKDPDSDYGVSFPDFPGCVSAGATLDKAKDMASEALAIALDMRREDGEPAPPPSSLETITRNPDFQDGVAFMMIEAGRPDRDRTVRINVTMSARDLHAIDAKVKALGLNRSAFLVRAARAVHTIAAVKTLGGRHLRVSFDDDPDAVEVDLSPLLAQGGVFAPLRDPARFNAVEVGPRGRALLWRLPAAHGEAGEIVNLCAAALWLMAHPDQPADPGADDRRMRR